MAAFVALVGEGNKFSKLEMFNAVPGVSQADRRMRDLREIGWVIDNYKGNPTLKPDEYLVRKIGIRVDLGEKPPVSSGRKSVTGAKRRRIFDRDGNTCQVCFIAGGSEFADAPGRRATLTIGHIIPVARGGSDDDDNLRTECQRCNDESRDATLNPPDKNEVLTRVRNVGGRADKLELFQWMQRGSRPLTDKERIFTDWARLPVSQRIELMAELSREVHGS
ncbi:HNH endonuclease [Microcella sp.]|uniref:HNH endonuclease n=1 Tax=Microcella sp. TaxID=1913979 RepID=UPI00256C783F|nr:HNH endonuclease [Microcella sp.]MBX9472292.1 HNH endonuclease [Microcella sp.]